MTWLIRSPGLTTCSRTSAASTMSNPEPTPDGMPSLRSALKKALVRSVTPSTRSRLRRRRRAPSLQPLGEQAAGTSEVEDPAGRPACRSFEIRPCELSSLGLSWYSSVRAMRLPSPKPAFGAGR